MKHASRPAAAMLLAFTLAACNGAAGTAADPLAGGTPASAKIPHVALGQAVDAQGKPLVGVTIDIRGKATENGKSVTYDPTTDAAGKWRQESITPGSYKVSAWREVTYNGRKYQLPLWSPQGKFTDDLLSKDGIVRDFVWKISGEKPGALASMTDGDGAFYGGTVLYNGGDFRGTALELPEAGTQLLVKLVPDGALMDGTAGKELLETVPYKHNGGIHIGKNNDVPLGKYTVSAEAKLADGSTRALRVLTKASTEDADYKPTATLEFEPNTMSHLRPYQEFPVKKVNLYMKL